MKEQELVEQLVDLARHLGFEVRTDQGPFRDGVCRFVESSDPAPEHKVIILNRHSSTHRKVVALSQALSECALNDLYLRPAVREAIESTRVMNPETTNPTINES